MNFAGYSYPLEADYKAVVFESPFNNGDILILNYDLCVVAILFRAQLYQNNLQLQRLDILSLHKHLRSCIFTNAQPHIFDNGYQKVGAVPVARWTHGVWARHAVSFAGQRQSDLKLRV